MLLHITGSGTALTEQGLLTVEQQIGRQIPATLTVPSCLNTMGDQPNRRTSPSTARQITLTMGVPFRPSLGLTIDTITRSKSYARTRVVSPQGSFRLRATLAVISYVSRRMATTPAACTFGIMKRNPEETRRQPMPMSTLSQAALTTSSPT